MNAVSLPTPDDAVVARNAIEARISDDIIPSRATPRATTKRKPTVARSSSPRTAAPPVTLLTTAEYDRLT
ncbi:MAG: hypothetical protein H6705_16315 [Myxococcales bacterium]|nr:hypothetical protein [Myxococcales bacterium]